MNVSKPACLAAVSLCVAILSLHGQAIAAAGAHAPITITRDSDFQGCACVVGGSGTVADPFVIGPLTINSLGPGNAAVSIDGTSLTKSFTLMNLTIAGNGSATSTGIVLNHINPSGKATISAAVTGTQTSIQSEGTGILVENSSFVVLDGGGASASGAGIGTFAGTINKNFAGGIDIENSRNITVKGWQLSANGQDNSPDFLAFDPSLAHWGVGAIRLFASSHILIDHNASNNCTTVSF